MFYFSKFIVISKSISRIKQNKPQFFPKDNVDLSMEYLTKIYITEMVCKLILYAYEKLQQ